MRLLDYFRYIRNSTTNSTAGIAKERLQVLVVDEGSERNASSYLPQLQNEILAVIKKYVSVSDDAVQIQLDHDDHQDILELNITLPEH